MVKITKEIAKTIYHEMVLVRKFEDKCSQLYGMGHIAGFLHLYNGQEAIVAGINQLLKDQDTTITSYRCHAHALLHGKISCNALMAELTGRVTGCSKGKGGSMHIYSKENGFFGGNGIVGAQIPIGAGLGFSHKYKKDGGLCVASYGDGASSQGQVYEAFNLAALWEIPVVFLLEDNKYSMGTPLGRTTKNDDFSAKAQAFGVKTDRVNGMDVIEVMEKFKKIFDYVRKNQQPYFVHVDTYRYKGHSMSDPQNYRTREEVDSYRKGNDPILNFVNYVLSNKILNESDLKKIDGEIKEIVKESENFALSSPEPEPSQLYEDILI